ncbi:MAG: hypothetical protein R3349_09020 [Geminicoccaceae bacterium]|nr:hypothetical protein [Geminicoccaceae bacterium]
MASERAVVRALLERHGRTYADELGFDLARNTPSVLFRWLTASILLSARISADQAVRATRALADAGWTTASKMAGATWEQRVRVLNQHGYARYDERTSRMLGETAAMLQETYKGDLRRLRGAAGKDPDEERRLPKACKGLGDVGVDIFFREVQVAWDELFPFAGERALQTAAEVGLPDDTERLANLVDRRDFPRLTAALIRSGLARDAAEISAAAKG